MNTKTAAARPVRKALAALAASLGTTVTTLVLTAGPAVAAAGGTCDDWMCGTNHNETAAQDQ